VRFAETAVLDRHGCLVGVQRTRGVVLASGQRSIQATGRQTKRLLEITRRGCLSRDVQLYNEAGTRLIPSPGMYAAKIAHSLGMVDSVNLTAAVQQPCPLAGNWSTSHREPETSHWANQAAVLQTPGGVDDAHQSCIDPSRRRLTGRYLGS
jgi:type II secretory pathway component PulJ